MDGLLDPGTAALLARARGGEYMARRLKVAHLEPDDVGILDVHVRRIEPVRAYRRKRGGEGLLCRATLADDTGEVDLVLWDDETRLAQDGPFVPGAAVRLLGPTVRPGYRGGVELHLGACVVEEAAPQAMESLEGALGPLGETQVVGTPPAVRFNAEAVLETPRGAVHVVLWDEALKAARGLLPGAQVRLEGVRPHPALEGWYVADAGTRLRRA